MKYTNYFNVIKNYQDKILYNRKKHIGGVSVKKIFLGLAFFVIFVLFMLNPWIGAILFVFGIVYLLRHR